MQGKNNESHYLTDTPAVNNRLHDFIYYSTDATTDSRSELNKASLNMKKNISK